MFEPTCISPLSGSYRIRNHDGHNLTVSFPLNASEAVGIYALTMHAAATGAVTMKLDPVTAFGGCGPDKIRDESISEGPCKCKVDEYLRRRQ